MRLENAWNTEEKHLSFLDTVIMVLPLLPILVLNYLPQSPFNYKTY